VEIPADEVEDIRNADRAPSSLDQGVGESGETSLGDLIPRDEPGPDDEVAAAIDDELVRRAVGDLPEAERNVLTLRFGLGSEQPIALRETGRRLGLSSERVRQIEDQALKRLARDEDLASLREAA
jgi:RNA polymerase primary sigma factor